MCIRDGTGPGNPALADLQQSGSSSDLWRLLRAIRCVDLAGQSAADMPQYDHTDISQGSWELGPADLNEGACIANIYFVDSSGCLCVIFGVQMLGFFILQYYGCAMIVTSKLSPLPTRVNHSMHPPGWVLPCRTCFQGAVNIFHARISLGNLNFWNRLFAVESFTFLSYRPRRILSCFTFCSSVCQRLAAPSLRLRTDLQLLQLRINLQS